MRKLTEEDIELRSPAIQEMIGHTPGWLIRAGSAGILLIIVCILLMSFIIKFPDVIEARATITTRIPPTSFICKTQGELKLFVKDSMMVKKDVILAYVENGASFDDIKKLIDNIPLWKKAIYSNRLDSTLNNSLLLHGLNLGELQTYYNKLCSDITALNIYNTTNKDLYVINSIVDRLKYYTNLNGNLKKQEELILNNASIVKKNLNIDSTLLDYKVIAPVELDNSKSKYNQALLSIEQSKSAFINNLITINQLLEQKREIETRHIETLATYTITIRNDLMQLESEMENYKSRFMFIAPFDGIVSFPRNITTHQFVSVNQNVLNVIPYNDELLCTAVVPVAGSGKIQIGQHVRLKVDNYPSEEYGVIQGTVSNISLMPFENSYTLEIALKSGLKTTYKKKLPFKQNIPALAEIVTKDIHLIDRIFNKFRSLTTDYN